MLFLLDLVRILDRLIEHSVFEAMFPVDENVSIKYYIGKHIYIYDILYMLDLHNLFSWTFSIHIELVSKKLVNYYVHNVIIRNSSIRYQQQFTCLCLCLKLFKTLLKRIVCPLIVKCTMHALYINVHLLLI